MIFKKEASRKEQWLVGLVVVLALAVWFFNSRPSPQEQEQAQESDRLWKQAVLSLPGKSFSELGGIYGLAKTYGPGEWTSRTNNQEGWMWFPKANMTVVYNKDTGKIDRVILGRH